MNYLIQKRFVIDGWCNQAITGSINIAKLIYNDLYPKSTISNPVRIMDSRTGKIIWGYKK